MTAMRRPIALACTLIATSALAGGGQAYRCVSGGSVSFQQLPCATAGEERPFDLPSYPPQNMLARQAELEAERAARPAEAGYFYPAYPVRAPRVTHHHRGRSGNSLHDQVMGTSGLPRIR